jgi:hypothetical protein
MADAAEDDPGWLAQVKDFPGLRVRQDAAGVGEVRGDRRQPRGARQQRLGVEDDDRVDVHVGDPGVRDDVAGRLVDGGTDGQPRAQVQELADARVAGRPGDRRAQELPVAPNQVPHAGIEDEQLLGELPVGGEVVLPAQPVVVDAGDVRSCDVNPGRRAYRDSVLLGHRLAP